MSKIWIKICGITRNADARAAVDLGADALGAVFYAPSSRAIAVTRLADIFAGVHESVQVTALFVDPSPQEVEAVLDCNVVSRLQFHGEESESFCRSFGMPYFKAIRVGGGQMPDVNSVVSAIAEHQAAELILLDSYCQKAPGGTGMTFDWELAAAIVAATDKRVVLAGGLSPDNIGDAVNKVRPYGVDVSTGVESAPGIKDKDKLRQFIEGALNG